MPSAKPKVPDAPGLNIDPRPEGRWHLFWRAPRWAIDAGYPTKSVPIEGLDANDPADHPAIRLACIVQHDMVREWAASNRRPKKAVETLKDLSDLYQTHEASPFRTVKHNTRKTYTQELGLIERWIGARRLSALGATDFVRWHKEAAASVDGDGGARKAQAIVKRLRAIISFGVVAEIPDCARLDTILGKLRFPMPKPRDERMTFEQAAAIIAKAHEMGRPSIALAQAIQFETGLRQCDVIGQWAPCDPKDASPYRVGSSKWGGGLLWQSIGVDLVLTLRTSKTGAVVSHALAEMPLVVAEIDRTPRDRRIGPMIVSEATGHPYGPGIFAKTWRKIATAAGVPTHVWNRDSRAGALSEGDEAGAGISQLQRMAGHTTPTMTARYVRGAAVTGSKEIAVLRAKKRGENAT